MLKKERKNNAYIAKNDYTGENHNHVDISFSSSSNTRCRLPPLYWFFELLKTLH